MQKFEYNISILIPVYNAQNTVEDTIKSVLEQEVNEDFKYEILLINDGSSDGSEEICLKYSKEYSFIKYFSHENRGVSYTRNRGLDLAKGKYILFLDADDLISKDTLDSIVKTFERYNDEADLLAYPIYRLVNGNIMTHPRTSTYNSSGVYDINAYPHINQTTMNIVIKNLKEKKYFDENMSFAEDSFFNTNMVMAQGKIILCSKGAYYYRANLYSAVQRHKSPVNVAYALLEFLEKLLMINQGKSEEVSKYVQSIIMYEINWRIHSNSLFPRHLEEIEYKNWTERFYKILNCIDNNIILEHPHIDYYHKFYLINLKDTKIDLYANENHISIISDQAKIIHEIRNFQLVFSNFKIKKETLWICGFIKAPMLEKLKDNLKLFIKINGFSQELTLYKSNFSFYKSVESTNLFLQFEKKIPLKNNGDIEIDFKVVYRNIIYPTSFYFKENTIIKTNILKEQKLVSKNYSIDVTDDAIKVKKLKGVTGFFKRLKIKHEINKKIIKVGYLPLVIFKLFSKSKGKKEINLYCDSPLVYGEAYLLFKKNVGEKGKKSYYIYNVSDGINVNRKFTNEERKYLIVKDSLQHKKLFMKANKVYSSSTKMSNYSPFSLKAYNLLAEYFIYDLIWLKTSVNNGYAPNYYAKELTNVDQILVKYNKDKKLLTQLYNYLPDQIEIRDFEYEKKLDNTKKILIAFTWRSYLTKSNANSFQEIRLGRFANSTYYKNLLSLLDSNVLKKISENYEVEFYIHPKLKNYQDLLNKVNLSISFIDELKNINNYFLLITDYTQLINVFEANGKKVLKYHIDFEEFKAGNHIYSSLVDEEDYIYNLEKLLVEIKASLDLTGVENEI